MFGKRKKQAIVSNIGYDATTDTYTYDGSSICVDACNDGATFVLRIDGNTIRMTRKEFLMVYMYCGLMFKKYSNQ